MDQNSSGGSHEELEAIALIEIDKSKNNLWTWSYPIVRKELEEVTLVDLNALNMGQDSFIYTKFENSWVYTLKMNVEESSTTLPRLLSFYTVLYSPKFNPEKFSSMLQLFARLYMGSGTPLRVLEAFISIFATGMFKDAVKGPWSSFTFSDAKALLGPPNGLKEGVLNRFGVQSVLLWNAMLLKKRVFVFSDKADAVLAFVRVLPLFALSRNNWGVLRPLITLQTQVQVNELRKAGVYCAGFTDPALRTRTDLYDVLVDLQTSEIEVAEHSTADFKMGAFHKEVAKMLMDLASNASMGDEEIVQAIAARTDQILAELRSAAPAGQKLTVAMLQEKKGIPAHFKRFLHNLALAEGVMT